MITDREFIDIAAKGLKIEREPLKPLAEKTGLSVDEVIERIKRLIDEGKVRRFAASVRHQPMGYSHNAMVIARTNEKELDNVGNKARAQNAVSHCYQRAHPDGYPYCVYIMMHGQDETVILDALEQINNIPGVESVEVCNSVKELKKTSVSGVTTNLDDLP